jgi:hypothetical protein
LQFGVLCSGYVPAGCDEAWQVLLEGRGALQLPSFHLYSTSGADLQVPRGRSEQLVRCFEAAPRTVVEHQGGHHIPSDAEVCAALKDFLRPFQQQLAAGQPQGA